MELAAQPSSTLSVMRIGMEIRVIKRSPKLEKLSNLILDGLIQFKDVK
jgi:hypothetical protein